MKKCPTCERTYDDNMKFCQNDGATLENFDPYATMVAVQPPAPAAPAEEEPLQIPDFDPNKTSVFSSQDQADVLSTPDPFAGLPTPEPEPFIPPPPPPMPEMPPISQPASIPPPPAPSFAEPEQIYQPPPSPFDSPFAEPPTQQMNVPHGASPDWAPPPAPVQQWGDQAAGFGSNTPFQPPGAAAGQSSGLAIASMIVGIVSLPGICCYLGLILGPAAAIMGFIARNKAASDPARYGGQGMAMAGIITGIIAFVVNIAFIILYILGFAIQGLNNGRF